MIKTLIFGGTTEGRQLAEFCAEQGIYADISVTTEYGAELLPKSEFIKVLVGKLDETQIVALLKDKSYSTVIDATHPYAQLATTNIKRACKDVCTEYFRLLREPAELFGTVFDTITQAVNYLNSSDKTALITVGSKELPEFTLIHNFRERLYARVLPAENIFEQCRALGFSPEKIIAEKGPFSVEHNILHIKSSRAEILVTKESGANGGYPEKCEAARKLGIELLTIRRPNEQGFSPRDIQRILLEKTV